jgi:hypothetical protein
MTTGGGNTELGLNGDLYWGDFGVWVEGEDACI